MHYIIKYHLKINDIWDIRYINIDLVEALKFIEFIQQHDNYEFDYMKAVKDNGQN